MQLVAARYHPRSEAAVDHHGNRGGVAADLSAAVEVFPARLLEVPRADGLAAAVVSRRHPWAGAAAPLGRLACWRHPPSQRLPHKLLMPIQPGQQPISGLGGILCECSWISFEVVIVEIALFDSIALF